MLQSAKVLLDWPADWLWRSGVPEPYASFIVIGILSLLIAIPLFVLWSLIQPRLSRLLSLWSERATRSQRKLLLIAGAVSSVLLVRGYMGDMTFFVIAGYATLAGAIGLALWIIRQQPQPIVQSQHAWETRLTTADGFPVIGWVQEVDKGYQKKDERKVQEGKYALYLLIGGPVIGWALGDWSGAAVGLFLGIFLLPAANRYATVQQGPLVPGQHVPDPPIWSERQPTEEERIEDNEPVVETFRAQAFMVPRGGTDLITGEPHLIVQWRRQSDDEVFRVFDEPWISLPPFELQSADRLFSDSVRPTRYRAPLVIIARLESGTVAELARDMGPPAEVQRTFTELTRFFGVEKRAVFMRERQAERKRLGLDRPAAATISAAMSAEAPEPTAPSGVRQRPKL